MKCLQITPIQTPEIPVLLELVQRITGRSESQWNRFRGRQGDFAVCTQHVGAADPGARLRCFVVVVACRDSCELSLSSGDFGHRRVWSEQQLSPNGRPFDGQELPRVSTTLVL